MIKFGPCEGFVSVGLVHGWDLSMIKFGPCEGFVSVGLVHGWVWSMIGYIGSIGSMDWFGPWMELTSFPEWYSSAQ
jgi:hypothetical protein